MPSPLVKTAESFAPLIREHAGSLDRERRLPATLVSALHEANLLNLWLPREFGGPELSLTDTFLVIEALAAADGAVGWCSSIATSASRLAAFLPPRTARHMFVDHRAIIAGSFVPNGIAVSEPGGYRVTGSWAYGSGIMHCQFVVAACLVEESGERRLLSDGTPEVRLVFVPRNAVEIIDTWDTGGLRGTGSHDFRMASIFVPDDFTVKGQGETPTCPGPFYKVPVFSTFVTLFPPVALGIARAAMDRLVQLASTKIPRTSTAVLREDAVVQHSVARAEARIRAARAFMLETMDMISQLAEADEPFLLEHRTLVRLAGTEAMDAAKFAVNSIYEVAGGTAVYENSGLQRSFRDLHAATQHMQAHSLNYKFCGQALLGLPPSTMRF